MRPDRSISDTLFDLGVTHQRDEHSFNDGAHSLFYAGRMIGRYTAHGVSEVLRENEIAQGACPSCKATSEPWWSYCAMCGWHIASGETPCDPSEDRRP